MPANKSKQYIQKAATIKVVAFLFSKFQSIKHSVAMKRKSEECENHSEASKYLSEACGKESEARGRALFLLRTPYCIGRSTKQLSIRTK